MPVLHFPNYEKSKKHTENRAGSYPPPPPPNSLTNKHLRIGAILLGASAFLPTGAIAVGVDYLTDPSLMVPVGGGNLADTVQNGDMQYHGAVAYDYQIGKYEVTNAQYLAFLNSVATVSDEHGLFWTLDKYGYDYIIRTEQGGGGYSYDLANSGYADRPVAWVSFYSAARFCNWLTNGGTSTSSTETGIYTFGTDGALVSISSHETSTGWALPTDDEWYKAAYYNPAAATYSKYPTGANVDTSMANYGISTPSLDNLKTVGSYQNVPSAYGTYDQAGNVAEWSEVIIDTLYQRAWGGYFATTEDNVATEISSSSRIGPGGPADANVFYGFRVVKLGAIPEPQTYALFGGMALLGMTLLRRRRK